MSGETLFDELGEISPHAKARGDDPETSHAAAWANLPARGTQRYRILRAHVRLDRGSLRLGLTDDELAQVLPDIRLNSLTTRRSELVELGWLEDSGERRRTSSGTEAVVWIPTVRARVAAASGELGGELG